MIIKSVSSNIPKTCASPPYLLSSVFKMYYLVPVYFFIYLYIFLFFLCLHSLCVRVAFVFVCLIACNGHGVDIVLCSPWYRTCSTVR